MKVFQKKKRPFYFNRKNNQNDAEKYLIFVTY